MTLKVKRCFCKELSRFEKIFRSKKSKNGFLGLKSLKKFFRSRKKFFRSKKRFFRAKKDFLGLKSLKKGFSGLKG